jgi:dienelactone hydrolase
MWSLGGDELAGQRGQREHHYGVALAARGFVVLCPDLPCFGQQQAPAGMPSGHQWEELCLSRALAQGRSLLSDTVDQLRCAVSALLDYERTAGLTVAAVGYGVGARTAAWLAFADRRIGAVWMHAGLAQQSVLLGLGRLLPRHNLLPGLLGLGLDQADIVAGILPRPLGISFGRHDRVAPPAATEPVLAAVAAAKAQYPRAQVAVLAGEYDHRFPAEVQQAIADHLLAWAD